MLHILRNFLSTPFLSLPFLFVFISCDTQQKEMSQQIQKTIESTISEITKNPSQPIDELKKLSQREYKVITFPLEEDPEQIESALNVLGTDRWECGTGIARPRSAPQKPEILYTCKRTPETVLRFVPQSIIGR